MDLKFKIFGHIQILYTILCPHPFLPFRDKSLNTYFVTEWQQEDMKSRTLSDEDAGSIKDGIWKRINTLEYYGVPSGSKMNLAHSRKDELQNLLPGAGKHSLALFNSVTQQ